MLTFSHGNRVELLVWSPDGNLLLSASENILRLWSKFGEEVAVLVGHHGWIRCCAWSPDGSLLATGGEDGTLRLWARSGKQVAQLLLSAEVGCWCCAWSPDGSLLATGADTLRVWTIK